METGYRIQKNYITAPRSFGSIDLFQIGRFFFRGEGRVREHLHRRWFELTVITEGAGSVTAGTDTVTVRSGDIFLSFPAEVHAITSSAEAPLHYDFLAFYTEEPSLLEGLERLMHEVAAPAARRFSDEGIRSLVATLIAELENEAAPHAERMTALLLEEVVIRLLRVPGKEEAVVAGPEGLAFRLMQYIDAHVFTLRETRELGEIFGYNYSYLSTLFRKTTGGTLSDYLRAARWRVARLLLSEGSSTVTEIAAMVGYSSVYVFSRAYRQHFGRPPSLDRGE